MAGHSKWSKVKHIDGSLDQKRGQLLRKLAKEISVAKRMGGGDPCGSSRRLTLNPEIPGPVADDAVAAQVLHSIDALESRGDVPHFDAPETALAKISG